MSKKRLGNDPFDDIDILKGPDETRQKGTSKNTSINTSKNTGKNTSNYTSKNTSINTSDLAKKPEAIKMTFYFYRDQLKQLDKLSKKTGRPKTELIRLALDRFFEQLEE